MDVKKSSFDIKKYLNQQFNRSAYINKKPHRSCQLNHVLAVALTTPLINISISNKDINFSYSKVLKY